MGIKYADGLHVVPVLAPVATTEDGLVSARVKLTNMNWVSFLITLGAISTASTGAVKVSLFTSSGNASTALTEHDFEYRISSGVGADGWGAVTAVPSTDSLEIGAEDGTKAVIIDADPAKLLAADAGARYVGLSIDTSALQPPISALFVGDPIYKQLNKQTST